MLDMACCMPGRPTHATEGSRGVARDSVYLARPRVAPTRLGHRCDAPAPMRRVHRRVDRLQRSTRSLVRGTPSQQVGRRWKLSQRARESSDGVQQQKASCGANRCTASMRSSSGTMSATPTRLARLDPAAHTMFTVYARRAQLTAASGCCFETIGRIGAALARRSSVLCIDTLSVQWRAARRARRAAVALGFTEPRTARAAAAHMGSRVALCARDV